MNVNNMELIGRLGVDPEFKILESGYYLVSFSVAYSERHKDVLTGEMKEKTLWFNVVHFVKNIDSYIRPYLKKGCVVRIVGSMNYITKESQEGEQRTVKLWSLKAHSLSIFKYVDSDVGDGGAPQMQKETLAPQNLAYNHNAAPHSQQYNAPADKRPHKDGAPAPHPAQYFQSPTKSPQHPSRRNYVQSDDIPF